MNGLAEGAAAPPKETPDRWSDVALNLMYGFTAVTLLGYATFGVHPELLIRVNGAAAFYSQAFRFFAVNYIWMAWIVLAFALTRRTGVKWVPAFIAIYVLSLSSELAGTMTGIPFGEYHYSPLLAPMWLDHVPVVIPLSWFFMAVPSYALAASLPGSRSGVARVVIASALLVSWDLSLDPAMSFATKYWMWSSAGEYYGMPLLNLFGWYVTGLVLMAALALLRSDKWLERVPLRWMWGFYIVNLVLPTGMNAAAGLWGAVLAAIVAPAAIWFIAHRVNRARVVARERSSASLVAG